MSEPSTVPTVASSTSPVSPETPDAEASAPRLLSVTVSALQGAGRLVATDWDTATFDVLPRADAEPEIAGVVLMASNSVAFYAVWPDVVPAAARAAVAEWALRANTNLTTSAVEFSADSGILAIRSVVHVGSLTIGAPSDEGAALAEYEAVDGAAPILPRSAFTAMLVEALDDASHTYTHYRDEVAGLLGG